MTHDEDLADQVLDGRAVADDELMAAAALLDAATRGLEPLSEPPAPTFLDAMVAATGDELAARRRRRWVAPAVVIAGAIGLGATGAAAANGSLPAPVQDAVHGIAEAVGIDVPESDEGAGPGRSDEAPGRPDQPDTSDSPGTAGPSGTSEPGRSGEAPGRPEEPGTGQGGGNGVGPDGVPPGQGGEIPGAGVGPGGSPPGQGGSPPGQEVEGPGTGAGGPGAGGQGQGAGAGQGGGNGGSGNGGSGNGGGPGSSPGATAQGRDR